VELQQYPYCVAYSGLCFAVEDSWLFAIPFCQIAAIFCRDLADKVVLVDRNSSPIDERILDILPFVSPDLAGNLDANGPAIEINDI
jgi:hypothetical protein